MIVVPGRPHHLYYIIDNVSEQNHAEHKHLGLSKFEIIKLAKRFMGIGKSYTGIHEGRPAFILGVNYEYGENSTWFLATKEYFSLGVKAVLHARRFLKEIAREHGQLITGSCSPHPDTRRWFKLIGYRELEEIDGVRWFVYDAPSQASVKPEIAAPGIFSSPGQ